VHHLRRLRRRMPPASREYIDKIVDLRRGMVDDGNVPQSLQKPLKALESRGNAYGKMEKKKADWANAKEFHQTCPVRTLGTNSAANNSADTLYFVDSITSYDDRMQSIGRATAKVLSHIGANFGILGAAERDSGHEVRRFGEETLPQKQNGTMPPQFSLMPSPRADETGAVEAAGSIRSRIACSHCSHQRPV